MTRPEGRGTFIIHHETASTRPEGRGTSIIHHATASTRPEGRGTSIIHHETASTRPEGRSTSIIHHETAPTRPEGRSTSILTGDAWLSSPVLSPPQVMQGGSVRGVHAGESCAVVCRQSPSSQLRRSRSIQPYFSDAGRRSLAAAARCFGRNLHGDHSERRWRRASWTDASSCFGS